MSALPEEEPSDVLSMKDFLEGTLRQTEELDQWLHQMRDYVRAKLLALELAEDKEFQATMAELAQRAQDGTLDPGLSKEEFRSRYDLP